MFTEIMLLQVRRLMLCLLVTAVSRSKADLQLSKDRTADYIYCGHLKCSANYNEFDTRVLFIAELSIYEVMQTNLKVKLASVSMFDPNIFVEPSKVNVLKVTGSVSRYRGNLTLSLRDVIDCLYRTFTCELDFLNRYMQVDVISDNFTRDLPVVENETCRNQHAQMEAQIKIHSNSVDVELAKINTQNKAILDQFARLETSLTSFHNALQVTCVKGMPHTSPREKFLLWGTIPALCDTDTDGGGWVIIQRRTKGDVDFYRDWATYKKGFGTPDTDFWIGNDNIHNLVSQGYTELRIDMVNQAGKLYAHYSNFSVADEVSKYKLSVSGFNGTIRDSLTPHSNMPFSTFDRDNSGYSWQNEATIYHGAWWYTAVYFSNLNGWWGATNFTGVVWYTERGATYLTLTEMKVRHL